MLHHVSSRPSRLNICDETGAWAELTRSQLFHWKILCSENAALRTYRLHAALGYPAAAAGPHTETAGRHGFLSTCIATRSRRPSLQNQHKRNCVDYIQRWAAATRCNRRRILRLQMYFFNLTILNFTAVRILLGMQHISNMVQSDDVLYLFKWHSAVIHLLGNKCCKSCLGVVSHYLESTIGLFIDSIER